MTIPAPSLRPEHDPPDEWDQTFMDAGYSWCRPCGEWHRPPECAVDERGRALSSDGTPWEEMP